MTSTWLITGSSRGFGRAIALAALRAGHRVAATARRTDDLAALVDEFGERVLPLRLDVTDPVSVKEALSRARETFGRLDVLVNNAGFANVAPVETGDEADFRHQFETNFWGVYNVSRAAVPIMREQGGGLIIQFSSIGGRVGGSAGIASYQAAKFAIDGFSRVLRAETEQFGLRILVVEPSGFRTDWAGSSMSIAPMPDEYASLAERYANASDPSSPLAAGDPERAAEILVRLASRPTLPHNRPLGANAADLAIAYGKRQLESDTAWRAVSRSADYGAEFPVPFPD